MKKLEKIMIAVAVVAALSFTGCSKKSAVKTEANADTSLSDLQAKGKLILGLDDAFPPLGFRDENNNIVGYDIDLASEVAKRLGVTLECQPIDWSAKEQELSTGKIDCIWNGFTMTPERKDAMSFTKAYLDNAQVVVVRADSGITTLADMKGKIVGVQAGSSAQDAIEASTDFKAGLKEIVEFKDNVTALNDLEINRVDGVVMDQVVANYTITQSGKPYVVIAEGLSTEEYGVAFKKGNIALRDKVQATLEEMQADGTVTSISNKWFGTDLSVIGK
ncbi:MAG: amino acid ABC transporter substrate-binding protein [Treponema sp.]